MFKFHSYFNLEVITSYAAFIKKRLIWNQLLAEIPHYLPSMTWEWHQAWLQANPHFQSRLHFLFIYTPKHRLAGIIPLVETTERLGAIHLTILTLAGIRDHIKTIFIAAPEHQLPLLDLLMHYVTYEHTHWDLLTFRRLGSNRGDEIFLERISNHLHLRFATEAVLEIPYIALPKNWETYWRSRKKHFRHEYRRKWRQLQQLGTVTVQVLEPPLNAQTFHRFVHLENSGWKGQHHSSLAYRPHLKALFYYAAQWSSPEFRLLQFELRVNQQVIAASLCPQTRDGLYVYKIAYDESMSRYSPGMLLRVSEIQYAIERRLAIYSFSGKAQRWMWQFTHRKHFTRDVIIYHHTLPARLHHLGYAKIRPYIKRIPALAGVLHHIITKT